MSTGEGLPADAARAVRILERTCADDSPLACGMLARQLTKGQEVPADPERAKALAAEACASGAQFACKLDEPPRGE